MEGVRPGETGGERSTSGWWGQSKLAAVGKAAKRGAGYDNLTAKNGPVHEF